MLEFINKMKENIFLKTIGNIIYYTLFVLIILILLVVIIQRISNNSISFFGFRIFNIVSGSMNPDYEVGDILISKTTEPQNIKVGDDIVYVGEKLNLQGKIITHRVVSVSQEDGKYIFKTKGIANEEQDPTISQEQIYGKIIYKAHILSFISKVINNIYAFYFFIFIPLSIIIIKKIRDIIYCIKYKDEEYEEDEENEDDKQEDSEK